MGRCQVGGREVVQGMQAQGGVVGGGWAVEGEGKYGVSGVESESLVICSNSQGARGAVRG